MMEPEQQGTTEMLDECQVQVHVNKDRWIDCSFLEQFWFPLLL
jgi:hypothetical protein